MVDKFGSVQRSLTGMHQRQAVGLLESGTITSVPFDLNPVNKQSVLEAIKPFEPDDGHKGTFLVLRIAGLEQRLALRAVKRKFRSWQNWRSTDEDFYRIDDAIPELCKKFGGEARVLRTALLDIAIVETGISIFQRILNNDKKEPVTDNMWAYAIKIAGIRLPIIETGLPSGSPWERLANTIQHTIKQRELELRQVGQDGVSQIVTAREMEIQPVVGMDDNRTPEPSIEQRQLIKRLVAQAIERAKGNGGGVAEVEVDN